MSVPAISDARASSFAPPAGAPTLPLDGTPLDPGVGMPFAHVGIMNAETPDAAPSCPPVHPATASGLSPEALATYRRAMVALRTVQIPFLVGGAYAFAHYTGIVRHTKDFDVFVHPRDFTAALETLATAGFRTEVPFPHWLGKAWDGDDFVDLIFSSGNGVARVDDLWFEHAVDAEVLGEPARLCPAEEMIWSKAYILERERYDGADIAHLLRARAARLDWPRLLARFAGHEPVLLSHLLLFGFVYPDLSLGECSVPPDVLDGLWARARATAPTVPGLTGLCRGTLLSRGQYLVDIEQWGLCDARLAPLGPMSAEELEAWTLAAREEEQKNLHGDEPPRHPH
jgi:hypothetical protein